MRNERVLMVLAAFVCVLAGLLSAQTWKDLVVGPASPIIVENSDVTLSKARLLSLREEIRLNGFGSNRLFGRIQAVDTDEQGRIIVLDKKECCLYRFDAKGVPINSFGKRGQGPGELERPFGLSIDLHDQQILVFSLNSKTTIFSYDGRFLGEEHLRTGVTKSFRRDSKHASVWTEISTDPANPTSMLMKMDSGKNSARGLAKFPPPFRQNVIIPFSPVCGLGLDASDRVYFGYPAKFEILRFGADGRLDRVIIQAYHPLEIASTEKSEKAKEFPADISIEFPKYHSAYVSFLVSEAGAILVKTWEKKDDSTFHVLYDSEGRCAGKVWMKGEPVLFRTKQLYVLEENSDGEQSLVRYSVDMI
jgi:hypothetical protein